MMRPRWKNFLLFTLIFTLHHFNSRNENCVLASSEYEQENYRELAGLAEKWNLTDNGVDFMGMNIQLHYIVSDFIIDSMIEAVAYTNDCKEGGITIPEEDMTVNLITDDTPPGGGDFSRDISVNVQVYPENIASSMVYQVVTDELGRRQAKVNFCMRFSTYTNGATPIEVNFLETLVGFTANLDAGFSIDGVNVEPKEKLVTTAMEDFDVDAYQCDRNNQPLSATALSRAMNQGEVIRVCVTPNQEAREEGVFMKAIESFTYYRDYGDDIGMVTQVAIENSQAASNFLTDLWCTPGSLVCAFETVLFASMFLTPGFVDGEGTALLQIGNNAESSRKQRRGLQGQSSYRSLREGGHRSLPEDGDGKGEASKFNLDFELIPGEEFNGRLRTFSSSSKTTTILSFIAMGAMGALNLLSI